MQNIGSIRLLTLDEKSERRSIAALVAVGLLGLAMASGTASVSMTSLAIRQAVAPGAPAAPRAFSKAELERWSTVRFLTVAHRPSKATVSDRVVSTPGKPEVGVGAQDAALDSSVPVAVAVQSRGLLAALLSLEADGDTTQTSEGLETIASPAAITAALAGAVPTVAESAGLAPRGERLLAAPGVEAAPVEIREVSLQIPETPARKSLSPAGSSFSS